MTSVHKYKMVNGERIPLTAKEIAELDARDADWNNIESQRKRELMTVRSKRNELLQKSDYTMLNDAGITNQGEWIKYRQALRDITKQDPLTVVWPQAPEAAHA